MPDEVTEDGYHRRPLQWYVSLLLNCGYEFTEPFSGPLRGYGEVDVANPNFYYFVVEVRDPLDTPKPTFAPTCGITPH